MPSQTESEVAVPHPRRCRQRLVGRKTGYWLSSQEIPYDSGTTDIVCHNQSSLASLADSIHADKSYILTVLFEPSLDSQGVVVQAYHCRALGEEEEGAGSCAWLQKTVVDWVFALERDWLGSGRFLVRGRPVS